MKYYTGPPARNYRNEKYDYIRNGGNFIIDILAGKDAVRLTLYLRKIDKRFEE
jgi:hypothetical protein